MSTLMQVLADQKANEALLEKLRANPNKVYFPNFAYEYFQRWEPIDEKGLEE